MIPQNQNDILQSKENASPHEDYGHKAMEYFRERIEQYGECTAVPIRSLLGEKLPFGYVKQLYNLKPEVGIACKLILYLQGTDPKLHLR